MSTASQAFAQSVTTILETIMFENWLRFYFITEKTVQNEEAPALYISIPEQSLKKIGEVHPHLLPLAQQLNGKEITFDLSRSAICTFVATEVDGKTIPKNMSDTVFESSTFQIELQLFNTWVQAHEDQLDRAFMDFSMWKSLFAGWRKSEAVEEWATQIRSAALQGQTADDTQDTVQ